MYLSPTSLLWQGHGPNPYLVICDFFDAAYVRFETLQTCMCFAKNTWARCRNDSGRLLQCYRWFCEQLQTLPSHVVDPFRRFIWGFSCFLMLRYFLYCYSPLRDENVATIPHRYKILLHWVRCAVNVGDLRFHTFFFEMDFTLYEDQVVERQVSHGRRTPSTVLIVLYHNVRCKHFYSLKGQS